MTQQQKHVLFTALFYGAIAMVLMALLAKCAASGDPLLFGLAQLAATLVVLFIVYQSVHLLRENARLVGIFLSTRTNIYVSGTYINRYGLAPEESRGLFGLDFAYLPWPLARGYQIPTEGYKVMFDATDPVYDRNGIGLLADSTLFLQHRGEVDHLLVALGLARHLFGHDYARKKEITYNGIDMNELKVKKMTYKAPILAEVLKDLLQEAVDSAILTVAGRHTWQEICRQDDSVQPSFSEEIQDALTPDDESSLFTEIGIFDRHGKPGPAILYPRPRNPGDPQEGVAALRIERATPKDQKLIDAQSEPERARLAADADAELGRGRGEHVQNYRTGADVSGREVIASETLEKTKANVTIVAASGIVDASMAHLLGRPGPQPPQQPPANQGN